MCTDVSIALISHRLLNVIASIVHIIIERQADVMRLRIVMYTMTVSVGEQKSKKKDEWEMRG